MWTCPKCGRTFNNENQGHYCGKAPKTVDEYILAQDKDVREQLQNVRQAIRDKLPDATEKISWSMPTYWKGHNIIHFAANKKNISVCIPARRQWFTLQRSLIWQAANTARVLFRFRIPKIFRWT